jgi:hypothetical protein
MFCLGACFLIFSNKKSKNRRPNIILFRRRRRRNAFYTTPKTLFLAKGKKTYAPLAIAIPKCALSYLIP